MKTSLSIKEEQLGEDNVTCKICGQGFKRSAELDIHHGQVHPDQCNVCTKALKGHEYCHLCGILLGEDHIELKGGAMPGDIDGTCYPLCKDCLAWSANNSAERIRHFLLICSVPGGGYGILAKKVGRPKRGIV